MERHEEIIKNIKRNIDLRNKAYARRAEKKAFQFKPFSEKQDKALTWWVDSSPVKDAEGIICDGAIRSGKTLSMSLSFIIWAMTNFSERQFGMAGKTIASFRRNVLDTLKQMLETLGYSVTERRGTENVVIITSGLVQNYFYIFSGRDERSPTLVQGFTSAGFFFDEVALMPESFVNQATARCSVTGSKLWFNCNPEGPRHWFKAEWIDDCASKKMLYIHFDMDDNLSLDEVIKERYRTLYKGVFFKRYILGEWCVAEGLIYSMFDEEKHVRRGHLQNVTSYVVSVDYGTVNPFVAQLWAFNGKKAQMESEFRFDSRKEGYRMDDESYYQGMREMIGDREIMYIIVDPSAASFIETIKKHNYDEGGGYLVKGADNNVLDGIRTVTTMLNKGIITIHASCEGAIEEMGLYSWDDKAVDDRPIKENDHDCDAMRYYVMTYLRRVMRWEY